MDCLSGATTKRNLMPRSEVEILIKSMNEKIDSLITTRSIKIGEEENSTTVWGYVIGVGGLGVAIILMILRIFGK